MSGIEALVLQAKLMWDGASAEQGMDSAGAKAEKMESKIGGALKKVGGYIAAAFTVDAIKNFVVSCVESGAEVSAETAAFGQIMGDYTEQAQQKMQSIADETGMVSTRLTPYMTSMTAKFKGLGFDIDDATNMASDGLLLAADAAAFWDMSLDDSMSHLNSFINGSYEGGEAIGLFANDTQMAAYAVEKGIVKNTKNWSDLDEATKQATRLEYAQNMMRQSGATGQAAKESGAYANVMANLAEKWRQFKAEIGEPIIEKIVVPAVELLTKGIDFLSESIKYVRSNFSKWMDAAKKLAPAIGAVIAVYGAFKVGTTLQSLVTGFQKARLAVSLFTMSQSGSAIATGIATGALKLHEIIVGLLTGKITLAQVATAIWTKVQMGLNAVLTANPIGLVVAAIAAIIAVLVIAYNKSETFRAIVDKLWAALKERLQPILQAVGDFIKNTVVPAFQAMGEFITTKVVPALKEMGDWLKEHILSVIQSVAEWISGTLIPTLQSWWAYIQENIIPALQDLGAAIAERVQPILQAISDFITNTVIPTFQSIMTKAGEILQTLAPILEAIKTIWTTVWTNIKIVATAIWQGIKTVVGTGLQVIKGIIQAVTAVIRGDWGGAWNAIRNVAHVIWSGIKSVIGNAIGAVRDVIANTIAGIRSAWTTAWNVIKVLATAIWTNIKVKATEIFEAIKNGIAEKFEAAKEKVKSIADSLKSMLLLAWNTIRINATVAWLNLKIKVGEIFDGIKTAITDKLDAAKEKVKTIVDSIVGFFTGATFTWPSIPLPHFSVKPAGWEIGDLLKGSIPSLGIEWYAKAMDKAAILDGATIFGASGGQLLGGGEAGREVVSGEEHLIGLINQAVARNNAAMIDVLRKILEAIQVMDAGMYDQIVDALVDGVKFRIDGREFGRLVKAHA